MSMDAMAGYVYELNQELIVENAREELDTLMALLEEYDVEFIELAKSITYGQDFSMCSTELTDDQIYVIDHAYNAVKNKMLETTSLEISMAHIDEEYGSSYNEVHGGVWCILNAVQPTAPAEKYADFIEQKLFCVFG